MPGQIPAGTDVGYTISMFILILLVFAQFLLLLASIALVIWVWSIGSRQPVPYVPTRRYLCKQILDLLELKPNSVFFELGSGDGRLVWEAHEREPLAHVVGIERRYALWALSRISRFLRGSPATIEFRREDLRETPLLSATHVYAFLSSPLMAELSQKFQRELHGARLISCDFPLPDRKPDRVITLDKDVGKKIFQKLYVYNFA